MIVVIAGMHRSGTSALAGMLHENGIVMGEPKDFLPKPRPENPKGFYENVRFRRVNDWLLKLWNYSVKSFNPVIPVITDSRDQRITFRMEKLINIFSMQYPVWGWKDPRTCLTMKVWFDVLYKMGLKNQIKIINIIRPENDIASSMIARGNEGEAKKFRRLARTYQKHFIYNARNHDFLQVNFADLIYKTKKTAVEIGDYLGFENLNTSFIDPAIADRNSEKLGQHKTIFGPLP